MADNTTNHISEFIKGFGGGTRQNRFVVDGSLGGVKTNLGKLSDNKIYIRSTTIPSSNVAQIPINWRGRTVNYPGDRAYIPWQITVLDDKPSGKTGRLFEAFHTWSNNINDHGTNVSKQVDPKDHFATDWSISHLDTNGNTIGRKFLLKNCWPVTIGEIALDMASDNTLVSFGVAIAFSHFEYENIT